MNRRDFLKLGAIFSAAILVQTSPLATVFAQSVEVQAGNKIYRGTGDGKIFVSQDERQTWQLHTNFGALFSVLSLQKNFAGQVQVKLGFGEHDVNLTLSENNVEWKTS
jgi:hypothetical protein